MTRRNEHRVINSQRLLLLAIIVFIALSYLLFDKLFAIQLPPYGQNLVAALLGTVITVALMMLLMQYQMRSEQEKEYNAILFEKKMSIYKAFLSAVFEMDDDNIIDRNEVQNLENQLADVALVGGQDLVEVCTTFILQLKNYGVLYTRSLTKKQIEHYEQRFGSAKDFVSLDDLMQAFRDDLSVVGGDVSKVLERVVSVPYDQFHMVKNPNVVD